VSTGKYLTGEEGISDGAALIANGFPVSWKVVIAVGCSFPFVRYVCSPYLLQPRAKNNSIVWSTHQVAVGLADPTSSSQSVQVYYR
jgi:hypothetical protein